LDFSDDEDQLNEKSNKQSLNGDIRSRSDNPKGYFSNKVPNCCDPSSVQNFKVQFVDSYFYMSLTFFVF